MNQKDIDGLIEEKNKHGWEDTIDNCLCGVHEISTKVISTVGIELSTDDLLELLEDETDQIKAEVLLKLENGDYEAELYEGDTPRKDFVTLNVAGFEFTI